MLSNSLSDIPPKVLRERDFSKFLEKEGGEIMSMTEHPC